MLQPIPRAVKARPVDAKPFEGGTSLSMCACGAEPKYRDSSTAVRDASHRSDRPSSLSQCCETGLRIAVPDSVSVVDLPGC